MCRVVAFGTFRTDLHPRVAVLLDGLREHGVDVEVVNVPLPLDTARRVALLHRPWQLPRLAPALLSCWVRLWVRGLRAARRPPDAVLVGYLGHVDVHLARLVFGRTPTLVLDHLVFAEDTARDRRATGRARLALLRALDRAALRRADVVVCDTEEHAARVRATGAGHVLTVPVGASAVWWDLDPPGRSDVLRVLFFGLFTPLQGTVTIAEAVAAVPAEVPLAVTLVGHGQDHDRVAGLVRDDPRVRLVPWLTEADLRREVARHDVVLGIFGAGDKARRVVPTKVYQGLAAGRVVVTSDTAPQRRALGDAAVLVPPGDAAALARALVRLAAEPESRRQLRTRARRRAAGFRPGPVTRGLAARLQAPVRFPPLREAVTVPDTSAPGRPLPPEPRPSSPLM
jgi:glycosyltransferase involved in cell wall biosynthesis